MTEKTDRIVSGFCFTSKEDADIARMELEKIEMLRSRMDSRNTELVLSVYNRAIMNRTFRTPVGYQYLSSVRERLLASGVSEKELNPIPLTVHFSSVTNPAVKVKKEIPAKKKSAKPPVTLAFSVILNVVLMILVGAMFIITLYSDNPNILNYRTQVINEYAGWEQELRDKEDELRDWEQELLQKENELY